MKKAKCLFEEDQPLLFSEENYKTNDYPEIPYEKAIAHGAVKFLGKWPSHLCAVFLSGCLMLGIIVLLILTTIFFSSPASHHRCRKSRSVGVEGIRNVYFVKHENRTWSRKELCCIETAARKHPELNVYLINLVTEIPHEDINQFLIRVIDTKQDVSSFEDFINATREKMSATPKNYTPEMFQRKIIAYNNFNVENIDVSLERLFAGSILWNVYKMLSSEMIEMAAKSYILWNYPGIALNPLMYNSLNDLKKYFCDNPNGDCKFISDFTTEPKGELQVSTIPCHAFAGFLMQEIANNRLSDQQHGYKQSLNDFCPRIRRCSGVRILKGKSSYSSSGLFCPTIYSDGFLTDSDEDFQKTTH